MNVKLYELADGSEVIYIDGHPIVEDINVPNTFRADVVIMVAEKYGFELRDVEFIRLDGDMEEVNDE